MGWHPGPVDQPSTAGTMPGQARHGPGHSTARLARPAMEEVELAEARSGAEVARPGMKEEEVARPGAEEEVLAAVTRH